MAARFHGQQRWAVAIAHRRSELKSFNCWRVLCSLSMDGPDGQGRHRQRMRCSNAWNSAGACATSLHHTAGCTLAACIIWHRLHALNSRHRILALFWLKFGPFKSLQTYPILACLLNPLLRAQSRPFICIGRSSTPAAETTTSFSWAQRHFMARGSSGGERRPWHPRPSSSTYFLPSIACVCCPPAASSARLLLPPAVLTRPPVVLFSLLSLQVLHTTVAAAVRSRPALSSISWPRAFERCKQRSRPKISAPAAGRERSWRPPDGAVGAIVCGFLTELGGTFQGYGAGGQVENGRIFFYCRNG